MVIVFVAAVVVVLVVMVTVARSDHGAGSCSSCVGWGSDDDGDKSGNSYDSDGGSDMVLICAIEAAAVAMGVILVVMVPMVMLG